MNHFLVDEHELEMLHKFAENNLIYSGSYEMKILGYCLQGLSWRCE